MNKYAMIFAAGKGTRLGDISIHTPKALVRIAETPLLYYVLIKLYHSGFNHVVVNIHHHAGLIRDFLTNFYIKNFNIYISDEKSKLFDTGGGLKYAAEFFQDAEHILLHNVDVISDIDLNVLYETHCKDHNLATIAVKQRESSRFFLFDENNMLKGWKNTSTGETRLHSDSQNLTPMAFSGIHTVSRKIFELLPDEDVFSMTDVYLRLCKDYPVKAYQHNMDQWVDVGKPEHFSKAELILQTQKKNYENLH